MTCRAVKAVALLTGAFLLASGSAYAGATLGRDTVGTRQVIDESLTGQDIRNGSLRTQELAPGAAAKAYTVIRSIPEGTTTLLTIPGFSRFEFTCGASSGVFVRFGDSDPEPEDPWQQHGITMSDITDNNPVGSSTVTGYGGGVGFDASGGAQPGAGVLVRGDYWGRADNLLAHGTISLSYPTAPCLVRLQVVVERLKRPAPIPHRRLPGGVPGCQATGAAFCTEPE